MRLNPATAMQTLVQQYQAILQTEQVAAQAQLAAYRRQLADLSQQYAQVAASSAILDLPGSSELPGRSNHRTGGGE